VKEENSEYETRSVTITPFSGSAGHVAHQATHALFRLASLSMFQRAMVFREVLRMGAGFPVFESINRKSRIPCSEGAFPVAMEVHSSGESMGEYE
jgi:hypothetical protein